MLLIKLCALLPAVVALPSPATSKDVSDAKVQIPYSVNCTSNADETLIQTTPQHYSTVQSSKWPLLIRLKDSPIALCGHSGWLILHSVVSADPSNSSFITSSTFYDSDQALNTYVADLAKQAKANSARRSLSPRGAEGIAADLAADATDFECPPCEIATTAKTLWDVGSWLLVSDEVVAQLVKSPTDDDPPSAEPSTCAVNSNQMPLDMEPPDADNDDGPCKVSCEDCKVSFGSHDDTNTDGSFQGIVVDDLKYTGTVVFKCDGKGDKDYKLELIKDKDTIGGGVNIDECELPDPSIGHEIDIDATLTGSYHVEGSGTFQFDFDIDSAAFQAQGNTVPTNPATTAFIRNFSGFLDGSYKLSADIDGAVKDITTLNGAQLAGYGINANGNIEVSGAGNATAASSDGTTVAQATGCMDKPTVDASGKLWLSVYAAGSDVVDLDLWTGDMTIEEGDSVCS